MMNLKFERTCLGLYSRHGTLEATESTIPGRKASQHRTRRHVLMFDGYARETPSTECIMEIWRVLAGPETKCLIP